jgi:hypothetical protein
MSGQKIRLKPKTHKGNNKLRQCGQLWQVIEIREGVWCCGGRAGMLIEPVNKKTIRWICLDGDEDFDWGKDEKS